MNKRNFKYSFRPSKPLAAALGRMSFFEFLCVYCNSEYSRSSDLLRHFKQAKGCKQHRQQLGISHQHELDDLAKQIKENRQRSKLLRIADRGSHEFGKPDSDTPEPQEKPPEPKKLFRKQAPTGIK